MTITVDSITNVPGGANVNELTQPHTCAGPDGTIIVTGGFLGNYAAPAINTATYADVAMTPIFYDDPNGAGTFIAGYRLDGPALGENDVFLDWGANHLFSISIISFNGVATAASVIAAIKKANSGNPSTNAVTASATALLIGVISCGIDGSVIGEGAGQTPLTFTGNPGNTGVYLSSKPATGEADTMNWTGLTTQRWSAALFSLEPAETGPTKTITGPDSVTDGVPATITGSEFSSSTVDLQVAGGSPFLSQAISSQDATNINITVNTGAGDAAAGVPAVGIPLSTVNSSAAGATAFELEVEVDGSVTRDIDISCTGGFQSIQAMIAVTDTSVGSFFDSNKIAVEDNMQLIVPTVVDGTNITLDADGTVELDANVAIDIEGLYFSPSTGQWSSHTITTVVVATNAAPTMPADTSINIAENTTAAGTFTATAGSATITYSVSGTDAADFSINSSSGLLALNTAADFETKASYSVIITATNSEGSDSQSLTINITNVNEVVITQPVDTELEFAQGGAGLEHSDTGLIALLATAINAESNNLAIFSDPLTAGNYSIVFSATDADDKAMLLTVTEANDSPIILGSSTHNISPGAFQSDYTILNMGGELPTLSGADVLLFSWVAQGSDIYRLALIIDPVVVDIGNSYSVTITADDTVNGVVSIAVTVNIVALLQIARSDSPIRAAIEPLFPPIFD